MKKKPVTKNTKPKQEMATRQDIAWALNQIIGIYIVHAYTPENMPDRELAAAWSLFSESYKQLTSLLEEELKFARENEPWWWNC